MKPSDLLPGQTYQGKKSRVIRNPAHPCCGSRNDRTIVSVDGKWVTYTSPAVIDARPPRTTVDDFLRWAEYPVS